ncbi:MAG: serine dehydratase beta chain, partial [Bacteroidales bacterium]
MESIKNIYRIGNGPSSSHTIGPKRAATQFLQKNPDADSFRVTLYGSLAATGKGHFTDKVINDTLSPRGEVTIIWEPKIVLPFHTNGMKFESFV